MAQDDGTRGRTFHGETDQTINNAQKARVGLRHAAVVLVCPNVTERTKQRIAQSKRARAGSLAMVDY